jgi:predicted transcriptional regulator
MKTTIDLPDDLLHRAKIVAAQRKTTLKEIVVQGISHVIENASSESEIQRKAALKRLLRKIRADNSKPMVPLRREEIYDR